MALFNYNAKEITLKIVYYGPGFSGKTTNLQHLHSFLPTNSRGKLISLATEADRTLFFDFLPVDIGKIKDFNIRFQLYTVPGQVRYNATRRLVLKGADAVVFVADSQKEMKEQNIESLSNMRENLTVNNIDPDDIPVVFQYNKRDIQNIMTADELNDVLNNERAPFFEAVASEGKGVQETYKEVTTFLIKHIAEKHKVDIEAPAEILSSAPEPSAEPSVPEPSVSPLPDKQESDVALSEPQEEVMPTVAEKTIMQQTPPAPDLSELMSAIGDIKDVITEISMSFKEIQKKQSKVANDLFELKQIVLEAREKKGLRRLFG